MAGWSNKYTSLLRRHLSFFLHTLPFLFASIVLSLSLPSSLSTTTPAATAPLKLAVARRISTQHSTFYPSLNSYGPYQGQYISYL